MGKCCWLIDQIHIYIIKSSREDPMVELKKVHKEGYKASTTKVMKDPRFSKDTSTTKC